MAKRYPNHQFSHRKNSMFDFDPSLLDDPEFKEDSVREEIIVPILKRLGYSASGTHKIVRSKALLHPFVMIGSKKHPVNIIPDYLLYAEGRPAVILDAKRPDTDLVRSKHTEQAYSYAIHPDVRVRFYALCNGRQFVAFDIYQIDPIFVVNFADIESKWEVIESVLSPRNVVYAAERYFAPDFGIAIIKMGFVPGDTWLFPFGKFSQVGQINDDLFSLNANIQISEIDHFASFDVSRKIFMEILLLTDKENRESILRQLKTGHFIYTERPILASLETVIGNPTQGQQEVFVPLIIKSAKAIDENAWRAFEEFLNDENDHT